MWRGRAEDEVNIAFARALSRAMQRPGKEFPRVSIGREVPLWERKEPSEGARQKATRILLRVFRSRLAEFTGKAKHAAFSCPKMDQSGWCMRAL